MSEVNSKKIFYRLRSLKSIFEYKELENQEIYFASLDELNDPMEGFRNVVFKGDKIVWRNLLRHYLKCLNWACMINYASNGKYEFWGDSRFPLYECIEDFPDSFYERHFGENYQIFIQAFNRVMDKLSTKITVTRNEISYYLEQIHCIAYRIMENNYVANRNYNYSEEELIKNANKIIEVIEKHENLKNKKLKIGLPEFLDTIQNIQKSLQLNFLNINAKLINQFFIDFNFVNFYLQRLEKLMYPECYVACFMEEANNSSVWGHYGDGHRGICLVFETDDDGFLELCGRKYDGEEECYKYNFQKVTYGNSYNETNFFETIGRMTMPKLISNWYEDEQGNKSPILDKILQDGDNRLSQYWNNTYKDLLTKTKDWCYEKEYRIIKYSPLNDEINKENRKLKYHFKNLHGIIFGMRTSLQDKTKIINIIKQKCKNEKRKDFNFYQAYYCQKDEQIKHSSLDVSLLDFSLPDIMI